MTDARRIVVIGGSGFIGSRLIRRLRSKGATSIIIDKSPSVDFPQDVVTGDVRSVQQLRDAIPSGAVIVNLAAEHRDDVRPLNLYDEVNVDGARNICTVARVKGVQTIIFTSSVAVYGFAPIGTDETGEIRPFNDYGRTKHLAEQVFRGWQEESPSDRSLVIIRPTVVFGERNRGNVYNLLRQIASGRFLMVGDGRNRKSMAYVENVAAFIEHCLDLGPGVHLYNFIDKPDFSMNTLVSHVMRILGRSGTIGVRLPFPLAYLAGRCVDAVAAISGRRFAISAIRVRKFCSDSVYGTAVDKSGFVSPVPLEEALRRTVVYEFLETHDDEGVFFTE